MIISSVIFKNLFFAINGLSWLSFSHTNEYLKYELDSNLDSKLEELKKEQNAFGTESLWGGNL